MVPRKTPDVLAGIGSRVSCRLFLFGGKLEEGLGPGSGEDHSPFSERDFAGLGCSPSSHYRAANLAEQF